MRREIKNLALVFGTLISLMAVLSSCQSFGDLVPTEYGAWENHYIYRGNVRSKTTGEDAETLVGSVTHGEIVYETKDCLDYAFSGDDIYLNLSFNAQGNDTLDVHNALVRYNVKDKTQETLCFDLMVSAEEENTCFSYEPYAIEKVFEDKILLYGRKYTIETEKNNGEGEAYTELWYNVDLDGDFLGEEATSYVDWARVGEDYWLRYNYEEYSYEYLTWGMENPVRICKGSYKDVEFVEKNGVKGFLISSENSLEFFDLATNTRTDLWEGIGFEWVPAPEYEYFMSSEPMTVTYTTWKYVPIFLLALFKETRTAKIQGNCQLFKIDYSADGVRVEKIQAFEKEKDFSNAGGVADGKLYVRGFWYLSQRGCKDGGSEGAYYAFDLTTKQFDVIEEFDDYKVAEDMCYTKAALENGGVIFGDYMYYIHRERVKPGLMAQSYTAYLLKRYRLSDEKLAIMQIWAEEDAYGNDEMENFCEEMWLENGDNIDDFIIRNY